MVILVDEGETASPGLLEMEDQRSNPANPEVNFDGKAKISYQRRSRIFPSRKQEDRALPALNLTFKSVEYSRRILFCWTEGQSFSLIAEKLRQSLSEVLLEFNPKPASNSSSVDFIEASSLFTLEDAISENSVLLSHLVPSNSHAGTDDHDLPLLFIQVTELRGGTMAMGWETKDTECGLSFLSSWSRLCTEEAICLELFPYIVSPAPDGCYNLRSKSRRRQQHLLVAGSRLRTFYFASRAVRGLKKAANAGPRVGKPFSIFHSLSAHLWMCITRARDLHPKASTGCSSSNFNGVTTAGNLARRDLASAAALLLEAVAENGNVTARQALIDKNMVWMGKFEVAGSDLNLGPLVPCTDREEWEDGRVTVFGVEGGGGDMGAHIVLRSKTMDKLENDLSSLS